MARVEPVVEDQAPPRSRELLTEQVTSHGRATNMKRTLAHSPTALFALMRWYDLHTEVNAFLGTRLTTLFAFGISAQTDCLICSTFFRRWLTEAGEDPDRLTMTPREHAVVEFGRQLARDANAISDDLHARATMGLASEQVVTLVAFGGMMIATNVFNNALKVDLDDYLFPFRKGGDMMTGLKGRVAVITGAAHGQGRAVALALAKEGVHVAALDVAKQLEYPRYSLATPAELESLAEAVTRFNVTCLPFAADVRDDSAVSRAIEETVQRLGRIDVLFNNAGICGYGLAHELTEEAWDAMLDINLKGAWLVARRVIPHMIRQKTGVIINNSSVMGLRGGARLSHYVASKWGLVGLTKSWAIELAPHNVRVVSIHPTGVNTPMNDGLAALEGLTPREIAERSAGNLLPVPWVEPEDVANAVVFLASEQARFVTGSQFVLDAGLLTR